jgi:hypothetical protein
MSFIRIPYHVLIIFSGAKISKIISEVSACKSFGLLFQYFGLDHRKYFALSSWNLKLYRAWYKFILQANTESCKDFFAKSILDLEK